LTHRGRILIAVCLLAFVSPATANVYFCTHNAAEIQAALTTSQTDGDDDFIFVVSGNYPLATGLTFVSSEAHAIVIVGGFDDSLCTNTSFNLAGSGTTLDGQHAVRPLYIANPNGLVIVEALTIAAGQGQSSSAGGGLIIAGATGIVITFNRFYANRVSGGMALGGALVANVNNLLGSNVSNNLLFGNRATEVGGAVLNLNGGQANVYNNTIVANITDTLADPGGLLLEGSAHYNLTNNIVWNNAAAAGSDFGTTSVNTRKTNDIGSVTSGSTAGTVTGELSVDPAFAPCSGFLCFSFELDGSSPLVNTGTDATGGPPPYQDLAGKPRILGPHVDIGAFEYNDAIFANGFEVP
jgi:hypothetical protein